MRLFIFILSLFINVGNVIGSGMFVYQAPHYYECIELLENGTFVYYNRSEFIKTEINGNWQLRNDSILVLDSSPQRSKLIVWESRKKNKMYTFCVRNMNNQPIHYSLFLISEKGDTIEFKDQFVKTVSNRDFTSFYIVDTKGQHSPDYQKQGSKSNLFTIMMEEKRVFENEYWKYHGGYIVPLGLDGNYSTYKLVKKELIQRE